MNLDEPYVSEESLEVTKGINDMINSRSEGVSFQDRVRPWLLACFGEDVRKNKSKRSMRFIEEAFELIQACGARREDAQIILDRVFDRPVGRVNNEIGGVMITLAALSIAHNKDMHLAGEEELVSIWQKMPKIRAKEMQKPFSNDLPDQIREKMTGIDNESLPQKIWQRLPWVG